MKYCTLISAGNIYVLIITCYIHICVILYLDINRVFEALEADKECSLEEDYSVSYSDTVEDESIYKNFENEYVDNSIDNNCGSNKSCDNNSSNSKKSFKFPKLGSSIGTKQTIIITAVTIGFGIIAYFLPDINKISKI